ncbi:MAG TPA: PHP domain-containing protein [Acidimicrobiia bacterium]|nr:PHP domain-containing protein [Acidimicrobiia bacterium]
MLDYHLHLLRHGEDGPYRPAMVRAYAEAAAAAGVAEICITEHLFRFRQADALLAGWWDADPDHRLRDQTAAYWAEHATGDLDAYVAAVRDGGAASPIPVRLGLEVDYYPGRMDDVAGLLAGWPFDLLLGSVHWLGAWGFDQMGDPVVDEQWETRDVEAVWDAYVAAIEELAATRTADVLAHPDLAKVAGIAPAGDLAPWWDRLAKAAAENGVAAEVSSAGWRKPAAEAYPAPPLLERFRAAGVAVTTASDAHELSLVADGTGRLRALLAGAGYTELIGFEARRPSPRSL